VALFAQQRISPMPRGSVSFGRSSRRANTASCCPAMAWEPAKGRSRPIVRVC